MRIQLICKAARKMRLEDHPTQTYLDWIFSTPENPVRIGVKGQKFEGWIIAFPTEKGWIEAIVPGMPWAGVEKGQLLITEGEWDPDRGYHPENFVYPQPPNLVFEGIPEDTLTDDVELSEWAPLQSFIHVEEG